ncbi:AraC-type DNA-binding protein [Lachnospiraceae bacterium]|nr:AraC-type DNA-binding protein [Lachnospiraceae bacterium]
MGALYQIEIFENNRVPVKVYNHFMDGTTIYTPLHWHRNYEFNLTREGRVQSYVGGVPIVKEKGQWNVVNSAVIHSDHYVDQDDHFEGVTVQISKSFVESWLGEDAFFKIPESQEGYETIRELMLKFGELEKKKNIAAGFASGRDERLKDVQWNLDKRAGDSSKAFWSDDSSTEYKLEMMELTFRFIRALDHYCLCDASESLKHKKADENVKAVINFIENNYAESISLGSVAEKFNYSSAHLSRMFKDKVGTNFHDYVQNVRITNSVEWLRANPEGLLLDCAMKNGFSNVKSFITVFRRTFGCTPSEWVKDNQVR